MSDTKTIRFIDSDYRELFSIMDGGSIRISYPHADGRVPAVAVCKYIDETHTRVGSYDYHICEFAERMETIGARYEPAVQIAAELTPFAEQNAARFYRPHEEDKSCIGHLRGDFGSSDNRFHHSWITHDECRKTPSFQEEFQGVMFNLRQGPLKDHAAMSAHCNAQPEARLPGEERRYGFRLETQEREYFVRCTTERDDYFYIFAYDKVPLRELEEYTPQPSVLGKIRESRVAPEPPSSPAPDRGREEPEL
ncbi:MAG: hypothetical protein LBO63_04755 [Oscillospiraceae bacterium]|nr:hypothetical protein [Oscillospiraceae bacterium]